MELKSCASPKSEMQASRSLLSRMLDDLMFPCTNLGPPCVCRYVSPLAAPSASLTLVTQSRGVRVLPRLPGKMKVTTQPCS